ncbi:hypothetical protein BDQ12DRAFT_363713 [Crucibulum laeve]|uniref:Uncharacterized protein n=1 Tax=Crucibulum laeve TaxID=68775 RepID=A0A5C3LNQ6_9AGAR|nr:hypothetical protein BDQ12DRAFT_363713 [Crucibulum laeve]
MTIQTTNAVRGYSDFFASGFRAVTSRVRRPASVYGTPSMLFDTTPHATTSSNGTNSTTTPRRSLQDAFPRRTRPASMYVQPPETHETTRRKRRSSIISFSTRLFDRMTSTSSDEGSATSSPSPPRSRRSSRVYQSPSPDVPEVLITAGGPYIRTFPNGSSDADPVYQSLDPFAASPDSKSFFIDLSDTPPSATPKNESFLSLTGSSPDPSFLHLPHAPRRERPTSIQTMPLPSRSRRSSYQYRPPSQEKYDHFLILEEEESPVMTLEQRSTEHEGLNDPADIDWRQFHIDLLLDDTPF